MNVVYRQINELELKEMSGVTQLFHDRFLAKHLFLRPGQKGRSDLRQQFTTPILVLMGMVGVVLLIACANVANLLLARGAARQKEVAIRLALGASRAAIVRQRLVESLVLSGAGALLGLALAWWTGTLLLTMLPNDGAVQTLSAVPDARVIAFAIGVALVTAILFGLAPALSSTRPALTSTLKDEAGSVVGGTGHARFRKGLVVAQVGLSVLLLAGAGLFARSLYNLKTLNPGFEADQLLGFSIDPSLNGYSRERSIQLFQQMQEQLAQLPDVKAATASVIQLLTDSNWSSTVQVEGYKAKEGENMNPDFNAVGPGFFATMGQPLVAGREFTVKDAAGAPRVAIINETMAKYYFGTESPLGRHIGSNARAKTPDTEIVGVVKDSKTSTLRTEPRRFVYTPYMQEDEIGQITFYVRARGSAASVGAVGAAGRAARRSEPADLRHEDDDRGAGRVAVPRADGGGAVGGVRRAGDAAGGDRPLRRDVLHRRAPDARDRDPHGARRRAQLGDVARAEGGGADGRHRRRGRPAARRRAQPRRAVAAVRSVGARSGRARRRRRAARASSRSPPATSPPAAPRASIRCSRCDTSKQRSTQKPQNTQNQTFLSCGFREFCVDRRNAAIPRCGSRSSVAAASAGISADGWPRPAPTSRFSRAARTSRRCARAACASTARRATSTSRA